MEAIQGVKTTSEIASHYEIHPVQVSDWKRQAMARMAECFETLATRAKKPTGFGASHYQAKVGQLTMEVDFLRKKCVQWGLNVEEAWSTSPTLED